MYPGNLSKIERGRLAAPQSDDVLNRIYGALEWGRGLEEANALKDEAAVENGQIPEEVLSDEVVMSRVPLLLRTVQNKQLGPEQLDQLIALIKDA